MASNTASSAGGGIASDGFTTLLNTTVISNSSGSGLGGGIRHNGDFVNTAFVEKAVAECPAGDDVFVYGIDAASGVPGEKDVVAVVVARPAQHIDVAALYAHCRIALESNFVPSYIQVMDEIPKTASEKPQERFCLEFFRAHPEAVFSEDRNQAQLRRQS